MPSWRPARWWWRTDRGVTALLVNGSGDLPESVNAVIANVLGTVGNRIYGKGNTKPSLAVLSSGATTTSS